MSQTKYRMNPAFKFLLALIISLEVSVKLSLTANVITIALSFCYLILNHIRWRHLLELILIPFIAAVSTFISTYFYGSANLYYALNLFSRVYVYTTTIACVTVHTSATAFARSLQQNFHLPSKFAYGTLAALGIVPQMAASIKRIRATGMMRGVYLSFWSPSLYFKAIIAALNSAENLAQGMESHGFSEKKKRSIIAAVPVKKLDWIMLISLLIIFNILLFSFH